MISWSGGLRPAAPESPGFALSLSALFALTDII